MNDLKEEINNLRGNKKFLYHKIGEKGIVTNHDHELIFSNIYSKHISYEKGKWICDICNKHFNFTTPNFYCDQCHFDVCNDCYEIYKLIQ